MTIIEFLEKYNYAPYALCEIAELVAEITDGKDLAGLATAYLEIKIDLETALDDIGFEFG